MVMIYQLGQGHVGGQGHAPQPIAELRVDVRVRENSDISMFVVTPPTDDSDVINASESTSAVSVSVSVSISLMHTDFLSPRIACRADAAYCFTLSPVSTGMGDRLWAGTPPRYAAKPTRSTQPRIPTGSLNRVPALIGWDNGGNVTSVGWQVTLCDPMWHVSSRSGEG